MSHFERWGVPVQRVLTDNGVSFRSGLLGGGIYELRPAPTSAWTHFYNWHRPHHGINLLPPVSRLSIPRKTS